MWLSTMVVSRCWSAAYDAWRGWSASVEASLNESHFTAIEAPGRNGRLFGYRPTEVADSSCLATIQDSQLTHRNRQLDRQRTVRTASYVSLISLRKLLSEVDRDHSLRQPTVVLMLAANFAGHLPDLIRRSTWGRRLVLVVESGRVPLPGTMTLAELAAQESSLGWGQIIFERDPEAAFVGALQSLDGEEPLIIIWPAELTETLPLSVVNGPNCLVNPL